MIYLVGLFTFRSIVMEHILSIAQLYGGSIGIFHSFDKILSRKISVEFLEVQVRDKLYLFFPSDALN